MCTLEILEKPEIVESLYQRFLKVFCFLMQMPGKNPFGRYRGKAGNSNPWCKASKYLVALSTYPCLIGSYKATILENTAGIVA